FRPWPLGPPGSDPRCPQRHVASRQRGLSPPARAAAGAPAIRGLTPAVAARAMAKVEGAAHCGTEVRFGRAFLALRPSSGSDPAVGRCGHVGGSGTRKRGPLGLTPLVAATDVSPLVAATDESECRTQRRGAASIGSGGAARADDRAAGGRDLGAVARA